MIHAEDDSADLMEVVRVQSAPGNPAYRLAGKRARSMCELCTLKAGTQHEKGPKSLQGIRAVEFSAVGCRIQDNLYRSLQLHN